MSDTIEQLDKQFQEDLRRVSDDDGDYDSLFLKYFSKTHGLITKIIKTLPSMSDGEKRVFGPKINRLQKDFKTAIEEARARARTRKITDPHIDMTFPSEPKKGLGSYHPITQTVHMMNDFFRYYGYSVSEGPEIENDINNFRKLNLPEGHPATDLQDTIFIHEPDILLRTHTSSIEARVLSDYKPPIRAVVPGKVYRNETASATNLSFFHMYQGFAVDKGITIQHLKGILTEFHKFLFGDKVILRFRYKYYPEVSPGMGVDIRCSFCEGRGCAVCKFRGWIEVLGSGMIHYNTLKMCGIDPEEYTGFAFGMGLDRIVMLKFGINDIRKLYGGGNS